MFEYRMLECRLLSRVTKRLASLSFGRIGTRRTGKLRQLSATQIQDRLCVRAYLHVSQNSRWGPGSISLLSLKGEVKRMISYNSRGASPDHPSFGGAGDFVPNMDGVE